MTRFVVAALGVVLVIVVALAIASCAGSSLSDVGTSAQAITATTFDAGGMIAPVEQEPSAVWVLGANPFGAPIPQLVVGYNDESSATIDGGSPMGWATSPDNGVTFTKCNANSPCNSPGVDVSLVTDFNAFLRHPTLVTDGTGRVVYVTLADTDKNLSTAERVVAVLSIDGGQTFHTAFPVNQDSCSDGEQDMPHAAFDYTTSPPTLWIAWRHKNGFGGSFGGCIRRFFIDGSSNAIVPLDDAHGISGMDRISAFGSQGSLMVQAGDGAVTVVYVDSDDDSACPGSSNAQAWGSVSTFNNAAAWVDNGRIFHTVTNFDSCLLDLGGHKVQNTIRAFDFVRTPTGIEYVVINDSPTTVRFFMSPGAGTKGWEDPTDTIDPWLEWCPGTSTSPFDGGPNANPTSNWIHHDDGPCAQSFFTVPAPEPPFDLVTMLPTIAVDGNDRVAIGLFTFRAVASGQIPVYTIMANANPLLPGSPFVQPPLPLDITFGIPVSVSVPQVTVVQPFGAYFDMIAQVPGGPLVAPGCSDNGNFFPFWVRDSDAGTAQIGTRGVQVQ